MLVKLLPDQAVQSWPIIEIGCRRALPPAERSDNALLTRLLERLGDGSLDCWVYYLTLDTSPIGFVLTEVQANASTEKNVLVLYLLYGFAPVPPKCWADGYATLKQYATLRGCTKIIAYTDVEEVIGLAKTLGATLRTVIEMEV